MLASSQFIKKWTKTSQTPCLSATITTTTRQDLNWDMQVLETSDASATWSLCCNSCLWQKPSATWFWWPTTRSLRISLKEETNRLMTIFSINSRTCLPTLSLPKSKNITHKNFALPLRISKDNQSTSRSSKMPSNLSTFSLIRWRKAWRELHSGESSVTFMEAGTVTWLFVQTAMLQTKDTRTFTLFLWRSRATNRLRTLSRSTSLEKSFQTTNVILARRRQTWQKAVT